MTKADEGADLDIADQHDTAAKELVWKERASKTLDASSSQRDRQKSPGKAAKKPIGKVPAQVVAWPRKRLWCRKEASYKKSELNYAYIAVLVLSPTDVFLLVRRADTHRRSANCLRRIDRVIHFLRIGGYISIETKGHPARVNLIESLIALVAYKRSLIFDLLTHEFTTSIVPPLKLECQILYESGSSNRMQHEQETTGRLNPRREVAHPSGRHQERECTFGIFPRGLINEHGLARSDTRDTPGVG